MELGLGGEEGNGIDGETGLFGLAMRHFGQDVHTSQIIGAVQQVEGVSWVALDAAQIIDPGNPPQNDPAALAEPDPALLEKVLACGGNALLSLHSAHLDLKLSVYEQAEGCTP
jgi:hypothetical protein